MNALTVKNIDFNGATLQAVRDPETGKIYAGVPYMCRGIGLSDDQARNERRRIQTDAVLSKGGSNLTLPTRGGKQEVLCIELDFLPLWLAKISITPNMQAEQPEVAQNLINYQLRAKDVLAAAFIKKEKPTATPSLRDVTAAYKALDPLMKEAGVHTPFRLAFAKQLYGRVGVDVPMDGVTAGRKTFDCTAIATRLGIYSQSGKPHNQAVAAIVKQIDVSDDEKELVPFQSATSGHSGPTMQYTESVIAKIALWLQRRDWPPVIESGVVKFKVEYRKQIA